MHVRDATGLQACPFQRITQDIGQLLETAEMGTRMKTWQVGLRLDLPDWIEVWRQGPSPNEIYIRRPVYSGKQ